MLESLSPLREFDKLKLDEGCQPSGKLLVFPERLAEGEDAAHVALRCPGFPCRIGLEGKLEHAPAHYLLAIELADLVIECRWLGFVELLERTLSRILPANPSLTPASTTSLLEDCHAPAGATKANPARLHGWKVFTTAFYYSVTTAFTTGFTTIFPAWSRKTKAGRKC